MEYNVIRINGIICIDPKRKSCTLGSLSENEQKLLERWCLIHTELNGGKHIDTDDTCLVPICCYGPDQISWNTNWSTSLLPIMPIIYPEYLENLKKHTPDPFPNWISLHQILFMKEYPEIRIGEGDMLELEYTTPCSPVERSNKLAAVILMRCTGIQDHFETELERCLQ